LRISPTLKPDPLLPRACDRAWRIGRNDQGIDDDAHSLAPFGRQRMSMVLAAAHLRTLTALSKRFHNQFAMLSLHFNHTILDCPSRTAESAPALAQRGEGY